jgi:hypothetical protein
VRGVRWIFWFVFWLVICAVLGPAAYFGAYALYTLWWGCYRWVYREEAVPDGT